MVLPPKKKSISNSAAPGSANSPLSASYGGGGFADNDSFAFTSPVKTGSTGKRDAGATILQVLNRAGLTPQVGSVGTPITGASTLISSYPIKRKSIFSLNNPVRSNSNGAATGFGNWSNARTK